MHITSGTLYDLCPFLNLDTVPGNLEVPAGEVLSHLPVHVLECGAMVLPPLEFQ